MTTTTAETQGLGERGRATSPGSVALGSAVVPAAVVTTPGLVPWWALVLTVAQVVSMFGCARDRRWGWSVGLGLQLPWAAYDVVTEQYPFLLTCALCTFAQLGALRRIDSRDRHLHGDPLNSPREDLR